MEEITFKEIQKVVRQLKKKAKPKSYWTRLNGKYITFKTLDELKKKIAKAEEEYEKGK